MKNLKAIIAAAALTLGSCSLDARCDDFLLSPVCPANPASPLSPANPANPASPLNPINMQNNQDALPSGKLDYSYCTDRPEKILKYGLIGIGVLAVGALGYHLLTRNRLM